MVEVKSGGQGEKQQGDVQEKDPRFSEQSLAHVKVTIPIDI